MNDLSGQTILLTRAAEDIATWAAVIEGRGGRAIAMPCLMCEPIRDRATARRLAELLTGADWLALASRRAVDAVAELHGPIANRVRIAAVGAATAARSRDRLGRVDLVPEKATSRDLGRAIAAALEAATAPARIVIAAAAGGRRDLEDVLTAAGARIDRIPVYRTVPTPARSPKRELDVTAIMLASPSAARGLANQAKRPPAATVVTIGRATTERALELELGPVTEARRASLEGMLEVLS